MNKAIKDSIRDGILIIFMFLFIGAFTSCHDNKFYTQNGFVLIGTERSMSCQYGREWVRNVTERKENSHVDQAGGGFQGV